MHIIIQQYFLKFYINETIKRYLKPIELIFFITMAIIFCSDISSSSLFFSFLFPFSPLPCIRFFFLRLKQEKSNMERKKKLKLKYLGFKKPYNLFNFFFQQQFKIIALSPVLLPKKKFKIIILDKLHTTLLKQ